MLTDHFRERFNREFGKRIDGVSNEALDLFMNYPWPGNIRELEHALEHAFVLCRTDTILTEHLPPAIGGNDRSGEETEREIIEDESADECEAVLLALEKSGWNKAKAARILGIDRKTIYRRMKKYRISLNAGG